MSRVSRSWGYRTPGVAYKIFRCLQKQDKCRYHPQSIGRESTKDITFTVAKENLPKVTRILRDNQSVLDFKDMTANDKLSKVSIVGAGMINNPGLQQMFEALYSVGVNIHDIHQRNQGFRLIDKSESTSRSKLCMTSFQPKSGQLSFACI